ncbi:recombinase family protein [Ruegeria sp. PrR005]|uniref:Recombinase family protein n=1 Tax=Ruegeria sp. PrR005 TaxID=2706882 RepID=A0A6B2NU52_9RHOB|nr:recombinase family protein [Ruegeria sp. PrR005]NDW45425.1 recombinase family protein [Ruegeria sp. PrR005]
MKSGQKTIRCAVYTRKSSEEGLEQAFNSLDAQHEACAAYIASQKHEGWKLVPARYDDGGLSGGTLERPALQCLLDHVEAGRVDMIVVYKIDRLTRSLMDFARLVDRFEAAGCSFVSVTQAFNTSSSMGRLTLNVLLSFAQFEREVTAERIRDKITASKKKGFWMGGNLPLGYDRHPDPEKRTLVINPPEAETVTTLFKLYDDLGALGAVAREADRLGLRSKLRTNKAGQTSGGSRLSNGQIQHLLRNPVYIGQIRHKDKVWPGLHDPILDPDLWARVQARLDAAARRGRGSKTLQNGTAANATLTGKLRDDTGDRLTPTHTVKAGRCHRYYVSNRLISGGPDPSGWRLPAAAFERVVAVGLAEHLEAMVKSHRLLAIPDASDADALLARVETLSKALRARPAEAAPLITEARLARSSLTIICDPVALANCLDLSADTFAPEVLSFILPLTLRRRGVETRIVTGTRAPMPDPVLLRNLARAHEWIRDLRGGIPMSGVINKSGQSESFVRTRSQLAFLSPRLQAAILAGTLPPEMTARRILSNPIPLDWAEQEQLYGLPKA